MRRKVIQLAGKTLVVSLPSKWVKKENVVKGNELELVEGEHSLVINLLQKTEAIKTCIDVSGLHASLVWHYVTAAYVKGVDELELRFSESTIPNPRTKKTVKMAEYLGAVTESLIGMEVVRYGNNFCVVKEVSEIKSDEFHIVLKRLFFNVTTFASDVATAVKKNDWIGLEHCAQLEKTVNRLCLFCWRALNKGVGLKSADTAAHVAVVTWLEEIADAYATMIASVVPRSSKKMLLKTAHLLEDAKNVVDGLYRLWYDFEKSKSVEVYALTLDLKNRCSASKAKSATDVCIVDACRVVAEKGMNVLNARIVLAI